MRFAPDKNTTSYRHVLLEQVGEGLAPTTVYDKSKAGRWSKAVAATAVTKITPQ